MVKSLLLILLFSLLSYAQDAKIESKIKALIDSDIYAKNRSFIAIIFKNSSSFYNNGAVDAVKVANTLKENGLLKIFYDAPHELNVKFNTNSSSLFFVKLMGDTLRSIGYYRFITSSSKLSNSKFEWSIKLKSEYAIDPTLLAKELAKRGAKIEDIVRINDYNWIYNINIGRANLNAKDIKSGEKLYLNRALNSSWLNISGVKNLSIVSKVGNRWYPNVAIYDGALRLLKVYKHDTKTEKLNMKFPRDAVYVKISDMYSMKNIKNGLMILGKGKR
ncbi:MAG: hypothetical protein U9N42_07910 [Campylobacterota bacterium]|nr:hypothetical protein [Campylobacterota bacterium]